MNLFRCTIEKICSICAKRLTIKLRRPHLGWKFWQWQIISGGHFFGYPLLEFEGHPGRNMECWECDECEKR